MYVALGKKPVPISVLYPLMTVRRPPTIVEYLLIPSRRVYVAYPSYSVSYSLHLNISTRLLCSNR